MKLAIIIFVLSSFLAFKRIECDFTDVLDGTYQMWFIIKMVSLLVTIISFIVIVVMM